MNDAYGDPRNYDPNDTQPFDYANFDSTWGNPYIPQEPTAPVVINPSPAPTVTPPPTTGGGGGKTPAQIEAEGREYDRQHGYVGGYMMNGIWVNGSPTSTGGGGENDLRMGGGSGQFDYGRPMGNQFSAYQPFTGFSYAPREFAPTKFGDLYDESVNPGFADAETRLRKQIEAGAAYQGTLRSGMTFDALGSILGRNRDQSFKALDDRRFRDFSFNEGNRFNAFNTNAGIAERDNQRFNDYRFNTEKATADDILSRWATLVNSATSLAMPR